MNVEDESYEYAKKRVSDIKGFYTHLFIYLIANGMLFSINFFSSPGQWWFYWTTLFWGIGLLIHGVAVFVLEGPFLGRDWERRKIQKIIDGEKKST